MEIYFEAKSISDPTLPSKNAKGKVKVLELNQDDDEAQLEVTCDKPNEFVTAVKKIINKKGPAVLLDRIMSLNKAMRDKDADEAKLKRDQAEREQAQKAVAVAREQTGAQKDQIFEEAKAKEAEFKKAEE